MSNGRRRRNGRTSVSWAPILGLLVVAALAFVVFRMFSNDELTTASPGDDRAGSAAPGRNVNGGPRDAAACLSQIRLAEQLVETAHAPVESWRDYVDARTREASGQISESERKSRQDGAVERGRTQVQAFASVEKKHNNVAGSCARVDEKSFPGDQADAARDCLTRARVAADEADAARAVVRDWSEQLARLSQRDNGEISDDRYQELWDAAYRGATTDLDRFLGTLADQYLGGHKKDPTSAKTRLAAAPRCPLADTAA